VSEDFEFTDAQLALISTLESTYAEACPGAGKTDTIVQRFIDRPHADARRGVALVSFTNAAIDEARSRCSGQPELVRAPNFAGTIDGFINRFVVAPVFASRNQVVPSFRDSWRNVPGSAITARGVQGQFRLDWFAFTLAGVAAVADSQVPAGERYLIRNLEPWQRGALQKAASVQWRRNVKRGIMDAAASRAHATAYLGDAATAARLRDLLSHRFSEVIVDEVQDCCDEDAQILRFLLGAGIRLIMVGDPDQGIYRFRGASAKALLDLRQAAQSGPRLDGNYRSSAVICRLVDSLRSSGATDRAVGKHAHVAHAIHVVTYRTPIQAHHQIEDLTRRLGFGRDQVVVLAHAWKNARACAGGGSGTDLKKSDSRLWAIALAVHAVQDESGPSRARADALSRLECLLQEQASTVLRGLTSAQFADGLGLSERSYRADVLRLATSLAPPFRSAPSAFKAQLASRRDAQEKLGWSTKGLVNPKNDKWPDTPAPTGDCLGYSTVHGYKGLQSPAVALVIPERRTGTSDQEDGVHLWSSGREGEARSVLYVGASRAQQLLILAVHDSRIDDVKATLDRDAVQYAELTESIPPAKNLARGGRRAQEDMLTLADCLPM
jgi:DNA helicase-2/ATP-dependent DNA helicase PcrA